MDNYRKVQDLLAANPDLGGEIIKVDADSLSIEDHVKALGISYKEGMGVLVYRSSGKYYAVLRRDDRKISSSKLKKLLGVKKLSFVSEDEIREVGFEPGLVTPLLLNGRVDKVAVDSCLVGNGTVICGAGDVDHAVRIDADKAIGMLRDAVVGEFTQPHPDRVDGVTSSDKIVYTADTPTGQLHIGHYIGTVKNRVVLQDKYQCYYGIANYHSYSYMQKGEGLHKRPEFLHDSTLQVAMDNLAIGIDPEKAVYYIESDVPETMELGMLFSMLVKHTRALRNPTIKDEIVMKGMGEKFSLGFVNYPMLQAADILLFKADLIPVGEDQLPHIEQSREIARDFNKIYGDVFPVPEGLIGEVGKLPGLDNRKMSKSLGNAIVFSESDEEIEKKVMSMYTDPNRIKATDPGTVEGNPVFIYHDAFNPDVEEVKDLKERYRAGTVGDVEVKKKLSKVLIDFISPIRERRKKFEEDPKELLEVLAEGGKKARKVASETLGEVREKMLLEFK